MDTKKTHRRYPENNWDYKAISTIFNDGGIKRNVVYYTLIQKDKKTEGVEVYSGVNYIVGSNDKSYSKNYKFDNFPVKYKETVAELKKVYKATKWSSAKYINEN